MISKVKEGRHDIYSKETHIYNGLHFTAKGIIFLSLLMLIGEKKEIKYSKDTLKNDSVERDVAKEQYADNTILMQLSTKESLKYFTGQ